MTVKAALLSAPARSGKGVFLGIVELESEEQLAEHHVPTITECDNPPGKYVWIPDDPPNAEKNPFLGQFVAIELLKRLTRPDFELGHVAFLDALVASGFKLPAETEAWRADAAERLGSRGKRKQRKGA